MVKSPWVHNHQLWLWDPWYRLGFHHPLWLRLRPKPLTPARQNNVIATAAPPATDATESSRKTVLLLSDASGRETQGQTPSDLQRDFWQPEHSAMHLKPVQLMKLLSVVSESSWIFAMFVGSYPPRYFMLFPCFGAKKMPPTPAVACLDPGKSKGARHLASWRVSWRSSRWSVTASRFRLPPRRSCVVPDLGGQDVDVWNLETPNGSMFV